MSRILFWLALVFLVMFAIRSKLRGFQAPKDPSPGAPTPPPPGMRRAELAETMLCCAHCGVYYPSSESVRLNGQDYCSQAHAGLPAR
jgi:uncharacterized protein